MVKKWEYLVVELNGKQKDKQEYLNGLGGDGWELVAVTRVYDVEHEHHPSTAVSEAYDLGTAYFKREKDK